MKYRVVQFVCGRYALERTFRFLWWKIGTGRFLDLDTKTHHWTRDSDCFRGCLSSNKDAMLDLSDFYNDYGDKKIITRSPLEKAMK